VGWGLKDIVFVGSSLAHFMGQLDNGMLMRRFIGSDSDSELKANADILVSLSKEADIRVPLRKKYGYVQLYTIFLGSSE